MTNKQIEFANALEQYLAKNDCSLIEYVEVARNNIIIRLEGDWKHTHLYCDYLVEKFLKDKDNEVKDVKTLVLDDTGSDWYEARRTYVLKNVIK